MVAELNELGCDKKGVLQVTKTSQMTCVFLKFFFSPIVRERMIHVPEV